MHIAYSVTNSWGITEFTKFRKIVEILKQEYMNVPKVLSRIRVGFINFSSYHGKTLKDRIFKSQIRGVESSTTLNKLLYTTF